VELARNDGELVTLIRTMLGELHLWHLNFYALPLEQSFVPKKRQKQLVRHLRQSSGESFRRRLVTFKLGNSRKALKSYISSTVAFTELGDVTSLIIDVRTYGLAIDMQLPLQ